MPIRFLETVVAPAVDQPGGVLTLGENATSVLLGSAATAGPTVVQDSLTVRTVGAGGELRFGQVGGNGRSIQARLTDGTPSNLDINPSGGSAYFATPMLIDTINGRVDANTAGTLRVGTSTQTLLQLGRSGVNVEVLGPLVVLAGGPTVRSGTGTPEGVVTATVGSLFLRTDGGASTTLYVKESGAGNTGWVAK